MAKNFMQITKGARLTPQTAAPSDPANGDMYYDSAIGIFRKYENGAWTSFTSASIQEVNAVLNPTIGSDTTGWTNGTSHTGTRVTTGSPLDPSIITALSIAATTTAAESATSGVYYTISSMPTGLQNKKLKVEFYFTTQASQTWAVSVYQSSTRKPLSTDSSGATLLPLGITGKFVAYFDTDSSAAYTIHLTRTAGSGTATLIVTNVIVGPGIQPQGAVVGDLKTGTPVFSFDASFVYTRHEYTYQRIGSNMHLKVWLRIASGSNANGTSSTLTIPDGFTVPSGFYPGLALAALVSTYAYTGDIVGLGGTTVNLGASGYRALLADIDFGGSNIRELFIDVVLPINEWAGSGTVQLAQNDVEYAYNSSVSDAADTTSFAYGQPGGAFPGALTANRSKRVRFLSPIQAGDAITLEVDPDGVGDWALLPQSRIGGNNDATHGITWQFVTSSTTDVDVNFGSAGFNATTLTAAGAWSTLSSGKWRVRKVKAGIAVGFGLADTLGNAGLYKAGLNPGLTTGSSVPAGYIGEVIQAASISGSGNVTANAYQDITGASIALTPGVWEICYSFTVTSISASTIGSDCETTITITDSANTLIGKTNRSVYCITHVAATTNGIEACCSASTVVSISTNTTYKMRIKAIVNGAGGAGNTNADTDSTRACNFYAKRIA